MSSATSVDGRRVRAVMSLLARGLGSLSFGKVLLGALMLWMAAAFLSAGGGPVQAEEPVTVELVGYFDQNTDGQDNNPVIPPPRRTNGATPAATAAIPVSKPALRQPAANTGTGDQAAMQRPRLRVDSAQPPSQPEGLRQPPRPRADANTAQPASTGARGGPSAGRANELMGGMVDLFSGIVSTFAGKKAGDQAHQSLTGITNQVTTALRAGHRLNTTGDPDPGNVSTPAKTGTHDRATHTNTDTGASPALPATHKTNQPDCASTSGCTENGHALTGRKPTTQPARGPPSGHNRDNKKHLNKITNSFVTDLLKLIGKAGGQGKSTGGSASQGGGSRQQAGTGHGRDGSLGEQISGLVENFVTNVLKLVGATGGQSGQGGQGGQSSQSSGSQQQADAGQSDGGSLGEQITELTGNFVQQLLKLAGGQGQSSGGGQSGQSAGQDEQGQPEQPVTHRPRPSNAAQGSGARGSENVDQLMSGVTDLVSGIVSTVAGKKAGAQTRQTLTGLADQVSQAIAAGRNGLDSRGRGVSGSNPSVPAGSGHDGGAPATPPDQATGPITCQALGTCPTQSRPTQQRAGAPQARGPPASAKKAPLPKGITKAQAANAEKIVKVGQKMGIPKRGLQVALATAFQESGLRNVRHGDRDSLGLFQQRPSQGWGSKAQVRDPTHAATEFFKHLKNVRGWQHKTINDAAQDVQRSGTPHAYAQWARKAADLVDHVTGANQPPKTTGTGPPAQAALTSQIQDLTNDFVTNLLDLLGPGQQPGQQGGQQGGQPATANTPAGTANQTGGQGQDEGWSLGNQNGQFAGTECQSETECALSNGTLTTRQPETSSSRAPQSGQAGSRTEVNQALNNRLAVLKGQKNLDKAKDQLDAKKITKAAYQKKAAAQKALQTKANRAMGQLSPDDQTLIKDTINDQRKLATAKTKLDAEYKQFAAHKLSKATYAKHAAAYDKQADALQTQTEQLRDAAGRTPTTDPIEADPGERGAGAACGRSGAFGECSTAAIDAKTGKLKQDQTLCMLGVAGCSSSSKTGNRTAKATCDPTKGCATTSRAGKTTAKTKCGAKDCDLSTTADERGPHTFCQARNGTCDNGSSRRHVTETKPTKKATSIRRALSDTANCRVTGGHCTTATGTDQDTGTLAYTNVNCDTKACKGTGATATKAQITAAAKGKTATRKTDAHHTCTIAATTGDCSADSSSTAATTNAEQARALTASSRTTGTVNCASPDCKGTEKGATTGAATGDVKHRASKATTDCTVHGTNGTCGSATDTEVTYRAAQTGPGGKKIPAGVVSVSHADSQVRCQDAKTCGGKAHTATSALDTAVSKHWRGASTEADCTVRGGGCQGQASSDASTTTDHIKIDPRTGKPLKGQPRSGPTATSRAAANVDCQSKNCSGTAHTRSAAWDGAVNNGKPRVSNGTVNCKAGAQSCQTQTLSNATTGPGATTTYADKPTTNRLGAGPSAASTIGGKLTTTSAGGKLTGEVTATNPSVSTAARGNRAEGYCTGLTGGTCTAVINGAAASSPDANSIAPMVTDQPTQNATTTNTPTGDTGQTNGDQNTPTSTSGKNGKNGKPGKAATASPQNPDQPGQGGQRPDQPATAPGSSANSGGPTVPGASSWTSAWANLNCDTNAGACKGTPHSSATGLAGDKHNTGGPGSRGPPHGTGTTTARCATTGAPCQASTTSTAGSGQVVADVLTERNKTQATQQLEHIKQAAAKAKQAATAPGATAKQRKTAAEAAKVVKQATKAAAQARKPVKNPPATLAQSEATAECAAAGCTARTSGQANTSAALNHRAPAATSRSHGTATCTAATAGCAVTTASTATTELTKKSGRAGSAQVDSSITCPDTGCTGKLTGDSASTASPNGITKNAPKPKSRKTDPTSTSVARASTACTARTQGCQAALTTTADTAAAPAAGKNPRLATTNASAAGDCQTAGKPCPVKTSSRSTGTDAPQHTAKRTGKANTTRALAASTCATNTACQTATGGFAGDHTAEVTSDCAGKNCRTRTDGTARHDTNKAATHSACTAAGTTGHCTNTGQLGASPDGAQAAATCDTAKNSRCTHNFSARSAQSSHAPTTTAKANASGHGSGKRGSGWVATTALTQAGNGGAQAAAACRGSKNAGCRYSYRAHGSASDGAAKANATGHNAGRFGSGEVTITAQAHAAPGNAQAAASCTGSKGTNCRHNYRASIYAFAGDRTRKGTYAEANASGSSGGTTGGGGVEVSATAHAQGTEANASASCTGARNCTRKYTAQAVASDRDEQKQGETTPGGIWTANGRGFCTGTDNNGCGVRAWAKAAPDEEGGGGGAVCTTGPKCPGFQQDGGNHFQQTIASRQEIRAAQAREREAARTQSRIERGGRKKGGEKAEKELTVEEAIKRVKGLKGDKTVVSGTKDKNGDVVLVVRDKNGNVETEGRSAEAPVTEAGGAQHGNRVNTDTSVIKIKGDNGQNASYNPKTSEFNGRNPTVPGKADDTARSRKGFELARDSQGRGSGSVTGDGRLHDGVSNTTVDYTPGKQNTRNTASFKGGGKGGNAQFVSHCKGPCTWSAPNPKDPTKRDKFKGLGPSTKIVGSNGKNGAQMKFEGAAEFTDGRLGEKIRAFDNSVRNDKYFKKTLNNSPDRTPFSSIITRDKYGNGGQYKLATEQTGDAKIYKSRGHYYNVTLGDGYPITSSGASSSMYDERRLKVSTPDNKGKGGTLDCLGECAASGPGLSKLNTKCEFCHWKENLATGEGPHPAGSREITNYSDERVATYTPRGDEAHAGGTFDHFTQYNPDKNGNGGGVVCGVHYLNGESCGGKAWGGDDGDAKRRGDTTVPPSVYTDKDGDAAWVSYGNEKGQGKGWACQSGKCKGTGVKYGWEVGKTNEFDPVDDAARKLVSDDSYRRPSLGTKEDKELAGLKAKLNKKDKDATKLCPNCEGDKLPPLTLDQYDALKNSSNEKTRKLADKYLDDLPEVSQREKDDMAFETITRQVRNRENVDKHGPWLDKTARPVVEKIKKAVEAKDDAALQKLLKKAKGLNTSNPGVLQQMLADRGYLNDLETATHRKKFVDPKTPKAVQTPEMQKHYVPRPSPADRHGGRPPSLLDEAPRQITAAQGGGGKPGKPQLYDPKQIAQLAHRPAQTRLSEKAADYEKRVDQYNNSKNRDPATYDALDAEAKALGRQSDTLQKKLGKLSSGNGKRDDAALRTHDGYWATDASGGDKEWAKNLREANDTLTTINSLQSRLSQSKDPTRKELGKELKTLGSWASIRYDAFARDPERRRPGNPLAGHGLPSVNGDVLRILNSAKNIPQWEMNSEFESLVDEMKDKGKLANMAADKSPEQHKLGTLMTGKFSPDKGGRKLLMDQLGDEKAVDKVLARIKEKSDKGDKFAFVPMLYQDARTDPGGAALYLYRISDKDGNFKKFVDSEGVHYSSFKNFRDNSKLADDSDLIVAENPETIKPGDKSFSLQTTTGHHTPGWKKAIDKVSAVALPVGILLTPISGPVGGSIAAAAGAWMTYREGYDGLLQSHWHGRTVNPFKDKDARNQWLTVGANVIGLGGGAALGKVATKTWVGAQGSKNLGAASRGLNISAQGVFGYQAGQMAYDTYRNWDQMSSAERSEAKFYLGATAAAFGAMGGARAIRNRIGGGKPAAYGDPGKGGWRAQINDIIPAGSRGSVAELTYHLRASGKRYVTEDSVAKALRETSGYRLRRDPRNGGQLIYERPLPRGGAGRLLAGGLKDPALPSVARHYEAGLGPENACAPCALQDVGTPSRFQSIRNFFTRGGRRQGDTLAWPEDQATGTVRTAVENHVGPLKDSSGQKVVRDVEQGGDGTVGVALTWKAGEEENPRGRAHMVSLRNRNNKVEVRSDGKLVPEKDVPALLHNTQKAAVAIPGRPLQKPRVELKKYPKHVGAKPESQRPGTPHATPARGGPAPAHEPAAGPNVAGPGGVSAAGTHSAAGPGGGVSTGGSGVRSAGGTGGGAGSGGTGTHPAGGTGGTGPGKSAPAPSGPAPTTTSGPTTSPTSIPAPPTATGQPVQVTTVGSGGRGGKATAGSPTGRGAPHQPGNPKPNPATPPGSTSAGGPHGPTSGGIDPATGPNRPATAKPAHADGHPNQGHARPPSNTESASARGPPPNRGNSPSRLAKPVIAMGIVAALLPGATVRAGDAPKPATTAHAGQERVLHAPNTSGKGIQNGKITLRQGAPHANTAGEHGLVSPVTTPAGKASRGPTHPKTDPSVDPTSTSPNTNPRTSNTAPNNPGGPGGLLPLPVESVPFRDPEDFGGGHSIDGGTTAARNWEIAKNNLKYAKARFKDARNEVLDRKLSYRHAQTKAERAKARAALDKAKADLEQAEVNHQRAVRAMAETRQKLRQMRDPYRVPGWWGEPGDLGRDANWVHISAAVASTGAILGLATVGAPLAMPIMGLTLTAPILFQIGAVAVSIGTMLQQNLATPIRGPPSRRAVFAAGVIPGAAAAVATGLTAGLVPAFIPAALGAVFGIVGISAHGTLASVAATASAVSAVAPPTTAGGGPLRRLATRAAAVVATVAAIVLGTSAPAHAADKPEAAVGVGPLLVVAVVSGVVTIISGVVAGRQLRGALKKPTQEELTKEQEELTDTATTDEEKIAKAQYHDYKRSRHMELAEQKRAEAQKATGAEKKKLKKEVKRHTRAARHELRMLRMNAADVKEALDRTARREAIDEADEALQTAKDAEAKANDRVEKANEKLNELGKAKDDLAGAKRREKRAEQALEKAKQTEQDADARITEAQHQIDNAPTQRNQAQEQKDHASAKKDNAYEAGDKAQANANEARNKVARANRDFRTALRHGDKDGAAKALADRKQARNDLKDAQQREKRAEHALEKAKQTEQDADARITEAQHQIDNAPTQRNQAQEQKDHASAKKDNAEKSLDKAQADAQEAWNKVTNANHDLRAALRHGDKDGATKALADRKQARNELKDAQKRKRDAQKARKKAINDRRGTEPRVELAEHEQAKAAEKLADAETNKETAKREKDDADRKLGDAKDDVRKAKDKLAKAKSDRKREKARNKLEDALKREQDAREAQKKAGKKQQRAENRFEKSQERERKADEKLTKAKEADNKAVAGKKTANDDLRTAEADATAARKKITNEDRKNAKASREQAKGDAKKAKRAQKKAEKQKNNLLSKKRQAWKASVWLSTGVMTGFTAAGIVLAAAKHLIFTGKVSAASQIVRGGVGGIKNTEQGNFFSPRTLAILFITVGLTRAGSVGANAEALVNVPFWVLAGAALTVIAHATTAVSNEGYHAAKHYIGYEGLVRHPRWLTPSFLGFATTWLGVGAVLWSMTSLPHTGPKAADPISTMISVATLASMGLGVMYQNWHWFREEVLQRTSNQRHTRVGLLLHDLALGLAGMNAMMLAGAPHVAVLAGGVWLLAPTVLRWSIQRHAPPAVQNDKLVYKFTTYANLAGFLTGLSLVGHGYKTAILAAVAAEAVFLGVGWAAHRIAHKVFKLEQREINKLERAIGTQKSHTDELKHELSDVQAELDGLAGDPLSSRRYVRAKQKQERALKREIRAYEMTLEKNVERLKNLKEPGKKEPPTTGGWPTSGTGGP